MRAKSKVIHSLAFILAISPALLPERANACSCATWAIFGSEPRNEAQNVPVNTAILISGAFRASSVRLENAQGEPVEATFQWGPTPSCAGTSGDLIPKQPLRPNTRYVLKVEPIYPEQGSPTSLTFTTGSDSLPDEEPTPPNASANLVYDVPPDGVSCGNGTVRLNIDVKDWNDVEVIARRGEENVLHWMLKTGEGPFKLDARPDCVEFRRRAPTGRRSSPVNLCGEALKPTRFGEPPVAKPSETTDASTNNDAKDAGVLTSTGGVAEETTAPSTAIDAADAGSCSSAPGTPTSTLPLLIALATLSLNRKRRHMN